MNPSHRLMPLFVATMGIGTFSLMDATMKNASMLAGVYSALLLRGFAGIALMLPVWFAAGARRPGREAMRVHVQRSAVVVCMAPLFFWGLVRIPMAEAIAISFIAPLIALYLSAVMLGEVIRPQAVLASIAGLAGVGVIAFSRIGEGGFSRDSLLGIAAILASAVFYAVNLVLQRRQAQLASPVEVAMFQNLMVAFFFLTAAPWLFVWPPAEALRHIGLAAVLAVVSLLMLSWSYARAEAQVLLPTEYTGFLWAALFGWLMFGETVTLPTLAGAALIVAGCWVASAPGKDAAKSRKRVEAGDRA